MRTKRQQQYDRLYYVTELRINRFFDNLHCWRNMRDYKPGKDFDRAFRQEVLPYWKRYGIRPRRCWFKQVYLRCGSIDPRFIPADVFHRFVVPYFDDVAYIRQMEDKNLYHLLFPGVKRPETVFKYADGVFREDDLRPIGPEEALARLTRPGRYILKPARDSGCGSDIRFLDVDQTTPPDAVKALLDSSREIDYIVQRILVQHPDLARFNDSSVNTLRLVTMVFKEKVYLLSSILRIGHAGSRVDNVSQGGYQAIIREDGTLEKLAYTHQGGEEKRVEQTDEGIRFEGFAVPGWEAVRDTALDLALKIPHMAFIGWDFAVDEQSDPVLIEINAQIGQNDENCGPTFGDMTEEVLNAVFGKEK